MDCKLRVRVRVRVKGLGFRVSSVGCFRSSVCFKVRGLPGACTHCSPCNKHADSLFTNWSGGDGIKIWQVLIWPTHA